MSPPMDRKPGEFKLDPSDDILDDAHGEYKGGKLGRVLSALYEIGLYRDLRSRPRDIGDPVR
jgi:hypothetical protein